MTVIYQIINKVIETQKMDVFAPRPGEKYVHKIINGHAKRSGFLEGRQATNFEKKEVVKVQKERRLCDGG